MKLVPKRKLVSGLSEQPITEIEPFLDHIRQTIIDTSTIYIPSVSHSGWFKYRLRIPEGADMFDSGVSERYEFYTSGTDFFTLDLSTNWYAQTFTLHTSHKINKVRLWLKKVGTPGTITVGIRATSGGEPTGSDLTSATMAGADLSTSYEWVDFDLTPYALTVGTKYAIVFRCDSITEDTDDIWIKYSDSVSGTPPFYVFGALGESTDSGGSWDMASDGLECLAFEEYGTTTKTAYIWVEAEKLHFIDAYGAEQDLENFDQDLNTTDSPEFSEILLTPKASSTGAQGTMFYDSDDNSIWVCVAT